MGQMPLLEHASALIPWAPGDGRVLLEDLDDISLLDVSSGIEVEGQFLHRVGHILLANCGLGLCSSTSSLPGEPVAVQGQIYPRQPQLCMLVYSIMLLIIVFVLCFPLQIDGHALSSNR